MTSTHDQLEKLFHEPSRLALLTELCASRDGLAFVELKTRCNLTDGNLNRHLQTLKESGVVKIEKSFVDSKPRTTVSVTTDGRKQFLKYLDALERLLQQAAERMNLNREASSRLSPFLAAHTKVTR